MENVVTATMSVFASPLSNTATTPSSWSLDSNWALAGLTLVLVLMTGYYAWETRRSRQTADKNLAQLQKQYQEQQEEYLLEKANARKVYVAPTHWGIEVQARLGLSTTWLALTNLGPAPGKDIRVAAIVENQVGASNYFVGTLPGLSVGDSFSLKLEVVESTHPEFDDIVASWPVSQEKNTQRMYVRVRVRTTFDEEMPTGYFEVGYY